MILFLLGNSLYAGMIPSGYNSWYEPEKPSKHATEFGKEPSNYWNGDQWIVNDPSFEPCLNGFRSINNRHFIYVDTLTDIVRFTISDYKGNVHILKSKIGPLFISSADGLDTIFLFNPNPYGYRLSGQSIEIPGIYPGVTCYIRNRRSGMDHQFVFSPGADTMIDQIWHKAGRDRDYVVVNAIELLIDSLDLELHDAAGLWSFPQSRNISGDIDVVTVNGVSLFKMPEGWLEQDSRRAPLYRRIECSDSHIWLIEGFRCSDISTWPHDGYAHNDSRSWQGASVRANISALEPGSSFYLSNLLTIHTDSSSGVRKRGLVLFEGLIDSLQNALIIDSALLELHYCGDLIGQGTLRVCRGIADSAWYNSSHATWNSRYMVGNDSVPWAGGWGVHTASYTTTNSVTCSLSDTNSSGYYQFPCKNMIADIKADGTDWGLWLDNGASGSQKASIDSGLKPGFEPRLYLEYRTSVAGSRRLKLEK